MTEPKGLIHHFDGTGDHRDEDGDNRFGFYFQIADEDGPACGLYGPYSTEQEAEEACVAAWVADDF